MIVFFVNLNIW